MNEYDDAYAAHENFFGTDPEPMLLQFLNLISPSHPVLDIGAGQGRNAFYLARRGLPVIAMDSSIQSARILRKAASEKKLSLSVVHGDVRSYEPEQPLSAILLFGLFQLISRSDIQLLVSRIREWTIVGGLVFVTAFSTKDSGIRMLSEKWNETEPHSFVNGRGDVQTWLEPDEILTLFHGMKVLHHREGPGKWHRHGDGPQEQHAMIEAVFQA
jgi:tellurite methyltransferase